MKDILEYTNDELEILSNEELENLLEIASQKESLYNIKQLVNKRLMNALYGALGNTAFPLFNQDMAAAITGNGRFFIQNLARFVEKSLQELHPASKPYIIYGDTDSIYYHIEPLMNIIIKNNPDQNIDFYVDKADEIEKKILQPVIQNAIDDFCSKLNAFNPSVIGAEREIISDSAIFVQKKKYFARVRDSEGVRYPEESPYIKIMGLDIIKSSTPKWAQKKLKEAIPLFLDSSESECRKWIQDLKKEFSSVDLLDICSVSGVTSLDYNLGGKGIPIGSRAALVHNKYIKENNLSNKIDNIQPGDKTKRLFLKDGNPFNSNIIAFTNDQFISEVKGWVDYDEIFYKNFLRPLDNMASAIKCSFP